MAKELTKRQRYWLAHIRRAADSGKTLKAYAQARRLSVGALYNARSELKREGILGQASPGATPAFIPVEVEPSRTRPVCRLRHADGWELELAEWPAPEWLRLVMRSGGGDASA